MTKASDENEELFSIGTSTTIDPPERNEKVQELITTYIQDYMEMSHPLISQTQPNLLPVTFTLWRRVALKHLRKLKPSASDFN